jgi:pilus assembly protein CpaF
MSDGSRKVTNVSEITGMDENVVSMQEIFKFNRKGVGPDGRVVGVFEPTHIRPKFLEKLRIAGIFLPQDLFEHTLEVN